MNRAFGEEMTRQSMRMEPDRSKQAAGPLWRYPRIQGRAGSLGGQRDQYVAINASFVAYGGDVRFDVFMKKNGQYFLFAKGGAVGGKMRERVIENGVSVLYIQIEDKKQYDIHADSVFCELLQDQSIPVSERSSLLHSYSVDSVRNVLHNENILGLGETHREIIEKLADGTFDYLSKNRNALSTIGKLMQHNNKTYNHCVNVSLYTLCMLSHLGYDRATCRLAGAGASLHDIGKIKVPREILEKPGRLTEEERLIVNNHPEDGLCLCLGMNLDALTRDCVVFHHEKLDGSGYPGGARTISDPVRIVTMVDIFDALTSERPYSKRMSAFEAMKIIMKDVEAGKLDKKVFAEFVKILTSNELMA